MGVRSSSENGDTVHAWDQIAEVKFMGISAGGWRRPHSRSPRSERILNRSSDVDEEVVTASAEPRQLRCRFSKPSTMPDCQGVLRAREHTDLKVSLTASIGTQARHRMPPLQF